MAPINTARLQIRPVAEADLPALLRVNQDDEVTRFLPYPSWRSLADGQAWLARIERMHAAGSGQQWVVTVRPEGRAPAEVIGSCLLFRRDEGSARAELGYVLGRAHWGQGLMREALVGLVTEAFTVFGLRRLEAEVNPLNQPSCRLLEGLGFVPEGLLRQRWVAKGLTYDTRLYGLLRDEWAPQTLP